MPHTDRARLSIPGPAPLGSAAVIAIVILLLALFGAGSTLAPSVRAQDEPEVVSGILPEGFDEVMAERVSEVVAQVDAVRGLDPATEVAYRVIDDATLRTELEALFREEYTEGYLEAEDALFTRLGLISPDDDLESIVLSLLEEQVLAFYEPRSDTFSLVGPIEDIGGLEALVVAHEYGHALQDARWDLEATRIKDLSRSDEILAQQALIEGDATELMYEWAVRELEGLDLLSIAGSALLDESAAALGDVPIVLRRQLEFPYLDGREFAAVLRSRGGWDAIDAAFDQRPVSTEQILHPELYPDELPVEIDLPEVAAALGPDWQRSYEQTLGEMQIHVWVAHDDATQGLFGVLPPTLPNAEAAAGWGGDRLVSLDGPAGAWAVVWQTDWDSDIDATEFREAASAVVEDLPGAVAVTDDDISGGLSSPVLVIVADGRETLGSVRGALGVDG